MSTSPGSPIPLFRVKLAEQGRIKDLKQLVARIDGLPNCLNGQIVDMGDGVRGIVMGFNDADVIVLVLGDESRLRLGKPVTGIREPCCVPVGNSLLGRMVTALGDPCDNLGEITPEAQLPILREAPPITARRPVADFLPTGSKIVDMAMPLAQGQRMLVLGDRVTGKTSLALDAILRQRGRERICIFCAIGKSRTAIQKMASVLKEGRALEYTVMVVAADSAPAGEQYLVPFAAATMGEFFVSQGRDVLVVFDDLTKHAWAYRQLSLLMDRAPGREAYPGDIFYMQTQLMERAGNFAESQGGGSMTFLGIAETQQGDLTGYIPSNLAAMSDGQIYMSAVAFSEGLRPPVDFSLSMSIVGRRVQPAILRDLGNKLRSGMAEYHELSRLGLLQAGLSEAATQVLREGEIIRTLLQQGEGRPVSLAEDILLMYGLKAAGLLRRPKADVIRFRDEIYEFAQRRDADLPAALEAQAELGPALTGRMDRLLEAFFGRMA